MKQSNISIKILTLLLTLSVGNITITMDRSSASAASGAGAGSGASAAVGVSYGNHGSDEMQLSYYLTANQNQSNIDPNILRKIRANILTVDIDNTKADCHSIFGDDETTTKEIDDLIAQAQCVCAKELTSESSLRYMIYFKRDTSKTNLLKYVGLLRFKPYGLIDIAQTQENLQKLQTNPDLNIQYIQYLNSLTRQLKQEHSFSGAPLNLYDVGNTCNNKRSKVLWSTLEKQVTHILNSNPSLNSYHEFMTLLNEAALKSGSLALCQLLHFLVFNKSDHR